MRYAIRHPKPDRKLTLRECEVMELLIVGQTNQQIANALLVAISTIHTHVANIRDKLGASNRAHATALYIAYRRKPNAIL